MSYLASLTRDGEGYRDASGTFYEDEESALCGLLGFCGCGAPDLALRVVRDALRILDRACHDDETFDYWYRQIRLPSVAEFTRGDAGFEYLVWYLLDDRGLTEHGGSVPGWLSIKGEGVLADLEEYFRETAPEIQTSGATDNNDGDGDGA